MPKVSGIATKEFRSVSPEPPDEQNWNQTLTLQVQPQARDS